MAAARLPCADVTFNLDVHDPIAAGAQETAWGGSGGSYVVCLGETSWCRAGSEPALPTLTASVGALTRLWLGVRPATGLAMTDALDGPADLLHRLDAALRLPDPQPDWDF
jgi:hypothetical protein